MIGILFVAAGSERNREAIEQVKEDVRLSRLLTKAQIRLEAWPLILKYQPPENGNQELGQLEINHRSVASALEALAAISERVSGLDLKGLHAVNSQLSRADLSWGEFVVANFSGANFTEANLSNANLFKANLRKANLTEANLSQANLSETILGGANLSAANFMGVFGLTQTQLEGACANSSNPPSLPDGFDLPPPCQENQDPENE